MMSGDPVEPGSPPPPQRLALFDRGQLLEAQPSRRISMAEALFARGQLQLPISVGEEQPQLPAERQWQPPRPISSNPRAPFVTGIVYFDPWNPLQTYPQARHGTFRPAPAREVTAARERSRSPLISQRYGGPGEPGGLPPITVFGPHRVLGNATVSAEEGQTMPRVLYYWRHSDYGPSEIHHRCSYCKVRIVVSAASVFVLEKVE